MPKSSRQKSKPDSKTQQKQPASKQQKEPSLPEKVQQDQADLAKWSAVAVQPNLPPQVSQVAWNLARSSQAALTLGQKALLYQEPPGVQENQSGPPPSAVPSIEQ